MSLKKKATSSRTQAGRHPPCFDHFEVFLGFLLSATVWSSHQRTPCPGWSPRSWLLSWDEEMPSAVTNTNCGSTASWAPLPREGSEFGQGHTWETAVREAGDSCGNTCSVLPVPLPDTPSCPWPSEAPPWTSLFCPSTPSWYLSFFCAGQLSLSSLSGLLRAAGKTKHDGTCCLREDGHAKPSPLQSGWGSAIRWVPACRAAHPHCAFCAP